MLLQASRSSPGSRTAPCRGLGPDFWPRFDPGGTRKPREVGGGKGSQLGRLPQWLRARQGWFAFPGLGGLWSPASLPGCAWDDATLTVLRAATRASVEIAITTGDLQVYLVAQSLPKKLGTWLKLVSFPPLPQTASPRATRGSWDHREWRRIWQGPGETGASRLSSAWRGPGRDSE